MVKTSVIIRVGKPEMMVIKMVILGMILFDGKEKDGGCDEFTTCSLLAAPRIGAASFLYS